MFYMFHVLCFRRTNFVLYLKILYTMLLNDYPFYPNDPLLDLIVDKERAS